MGNPSDAEQRFPFKAGDIFSWSYKDSCNEHVSDRYWCKSRIKIVNNSRLVDTYWHGNDNTSWTLPQAIERLDLTYLGNFSDLERIEDYCAAYYDPADMVNLNHSNSARGNVYRRRGAKRSRDAMKSHLADKIAEAESKKRSVEIALDRLRRTASEIDGAIDLEQIYV